MALHVPETRFGWLSCSPSFQEEDRSYDQRGACHCRRVNVEVVTEDGSPHGPKSFVLWNPPLSAPPPPPGQEAEAQQPPRLPQMSHTEGRTRAGSVRRAALLLFLLAFDLASLSGRGPHCSSNATSCTLCSSCKCTECSW